MDSTQIEERKRYNRFRIVTDYMSRHLTLNGELPTIEDLVIIFELPVDEIAEIYETSVKAVESAKTE